jgi:hypothetical protein
MSFAKRREELDRDVMARIEAFLKEKDEMAEQLKVTVEGELIVLVAEGEAGTCEIKLKLGEVERFEEALDKARKRVAMATEHRLSKEAMRVQGVDENEE